jgi:hypothetical protein
MDTTSSGALSTAKSLASSKASNKAASASTTPTSGPTNIISSTNTLYVGSTSGSTSTSVGNPTGTVHQVDISDQGGSGESEYVANASCTWSASCSNAYLYQLKIKFNFPSGITSANITSATLGFSYTGEGTTSSKTFAIAAPNSTTELTTFWNTNDTSSATYDLVANKITWDISNLTGSASLNILEAI